MKRKSKYLNPISFALTSEWLLPNLYNRFYVFFFTVCLCEQRNWKKQRKQNQTLSFEVKHNSANGNRHTRTRNKKKMKRNYINVNSIIILVIYLVDDQKWDELTSILFKFVFYLCLLKKNPVSSKEVQAHGISTASLYYVSLLLYSHNSNTSTIYDWKNWWKIYSQPRKTASPDTKSFLIFFFCNFFGWWTGRIDDWNPTDYL